MQFYVVYDTNEDGTRKWIDSYWLNYANAVVRFKKIWIYSREPSEYEIRYYVKAVKTED